MTDRKFIFDDLNSFVDGRFTDLRDYEVNFCNQLIGTAEMLNYVTSSRMKLEALCGRLTRLKFLQDTIDSILGCVVNTQNKWEGFLFNFENKFQCECELKGTPVDVARDEIYQTADQLFVSLKNYYDMIEDVDNKIIGYNNTRKNEQMYLLFQVVGANLSMLEKLNFHLEKLKTRLFFAQHIRDQIIRKCYCNQKYF